MGWYERLLGKKREWEERLLIRQRDTLFRWIEQQEADFEGQVIIALPEEMSVFSLIQGQWKKDRPIKSSLRFILSYKNRFGELSSGLGLDTKEWVNIFSAPTFEVWEQRTFYREQGRPLPLRLGLNHEEKLWMTKEVRRMMEEVLRGREPVLSTNPSHRLEARQDLDIALWIDGRIRASVIMVGLPCREALEVGSRRATWDKRFSPVKLEEVGKMRIEITLMSDLVFPVFKSDWQKNRIDPTKGYVAIASNKKGWYLPEVHNVVTFNSLRNFLFRLATEKAGIPPEEINEVWYGQFSVIDWVENGETLMTLSGPTETIAKNNLWEEKGGQVLKQTVEWLYRIQEKTGNLPAIWNEKGVVKQVGLPALGCTGHALAFYGHTYGEKKALEVADAIWQYLATQVTEKKNGDTLYFFGVVYFLRLSLILNKNVSAALVTQLIANLEFAHATPILWLQTLSFLMEYGQNGNREYVSLLRNEAGKVEKVFKKRRTKEQIAMYPELIALYQGLWSITKEAVWRNQALKHIAWYRGRQQSNGSFPCAPDDAFAYTRGTGKVFEVLACFPEETEAMLEKSFAWLQAMQYTKENTFFLNETEQTLLTGGFRHDAFNREVWIDASAHIILGLSRLRVGL